MFGIVFLTTDINDSRGSYRIWIRDLNNYLNRCGRNSKVALPHNLDLGEDCDVIICGKNDASFAETIKKNHPQIRVGIINPPANATKLAVDFVIVGSLEEKCSLSHYENVFLFPLIEKMYQEKRDYKKHEQSSPLKIAYHGNAVHLNRFDPHLKNALEEMEKRCQIELRIIAPSIDHWKSGKPSIKKITFNRWEIGSIKDELLACDIGIVPNVLNYDVTSSCPSEGTYDTDYNIRFKNKSNAGRSFVFHQLGIPVIADLTPSNFHILGHPDCGFISNSKDSWLKSLLSLRDPAYRQYIADNAKEEFDRLYDPLKWADRLHKQIEGIL